MENRSQRLPGLDLLRAAAILMVLFAHYPKSASGLGARVLNFGWTGVDLFFVLSGYLIAGQLFKSLSSDEQTNLRSFYLRRILRTLPSYFAVLAVYLVVAIIAGGIKPDWKFLFFIQNFGVPATFAPSWSLCVEEQFYLLFPVLAILLFRSSFSRWAGIAMPLLIALGIVLRGAIWLAFRPDLLPEPQALTTYMGTLYYPTYCRLDGIVFGAGLAALKYFRPKSWKLLMERGNLLLAGSAAAMVMAIAALWKHYTFFGTTLGFTFLNLSFALMTAAALSRGSWISSLRIPGAQSIAILSYAIYLTHSLAIEASQNLFERFGFSFSSSMAVAVTAILMFLFANLLYWSIERPALALRDRVLARKTREPHLTDVRQPVAELT
jgi:peptidoglycan/LPS O-acetylase OafA/YrhL